MLVLITLQLSAGVAAAQRRVALVIGNGEYKVGERLANPVSDAKLIATALKTARFEVVEAKFNLGITEFRQSLRRFQSQADGAAVAMVYFAGHGIEVGGVNWVVPTDAELRVTRDLEYEAIKLDLLLHALGGAKLRVLALDACRNNPFGRSWQSSSRLVTRGLNRQEADNVLVLFAAAPGQLADDGEGANSPFASALAKRLPQEGLAIQLLGGLVRDDVMAATGENQRPYVSASITGEPYYLVPSKDQIELVFWNSVKDSTSSSVLRTYVERYPNGQFAPIARALIEHYEQQARATLAEREEEKKRHEEARKEAEVKRIEEARRGREAELAQERIRASQAKKDSEVKRIENQERSEHAARLEELRKAQDQVRAAKEAARVAEGKRIAAVKAAEDATKAAEGVISAKRDAEKAKDPSRVSALPKVERSPTQVKKPPSRPDATSYSMRIWAAYTVATGQTVSTTTPHGTLTCVGGKRDTGQPRICRWN